MKCWANMDREVSVLDPKGRISGKALGIDEESCLLVEKEKMLKLSTFFPGKYLVRNLWICVRDRNRTVESNKADYILRICVSYEDLQVSEREGRTT